MLDLRREDKNHHYMRVTQFLDGAVRVSQNTDPLSMTLEPPTVFWQTRTAATSDTTEYFAAALTEAAKICCEWEPDTGNVLALIRLHEAQDSPYVQIVTWDKHPKDAANSQSANDSPDA